MGNVRIIGRLGPSFSKLPLYTLGRSMRRRQHKRASSIAPGDLLLADRARVATDGSLVVAVIDGDFYIRRLRHEEDGQRVLVAENARYPALRLSPGQDWMIRGVVTHSFRRPERWQPLA